MTDKDNSIGNSKGALCLGIFEGHSDPAVAIVEGGRVIAYAEEERYIRFKHAHGIYPIRALKYCLDTAGVTLDQVSAVGINWNVDAYTNGQMRAFYDRVNQEFNPDPQTIQWQGGLLRRFNRENIRALHEINWRRMFGDIKFPPLYSAPHHYVHAFQSCLQSPFKKSLCLTIDGSGDQHCTVLWRHEGTRIWPIQEIMIPHSLGWVYAAFTEYLGFQAYDGEYKVMGLAAYGRMNKDLSGKLDKIVFFDKSGFGYRIDPTYIHYGSHTYSERYTDKLVELFGRKPRLPDEKIDSWHEDLARAVQEKLEDTVERLVLRAVRETGIRNVCIGGGVGLNIKMNSRLFMNPEIEDLYANPLCSDGGAAIGAALVASFAISHERPAKLETLALGYEETEERIEEVLKLTQVNYEKPADICEAVADELCSGRIVGWFQGRMEAGPRALGQRSILADPRRVENRDKVNAIIKYREYWRPFCPSMIEEAAERYFDKYTTAPFMILSFPANERLKKEAPAIVHVDQTSRVQLINQKVLPKYYKLIKAFERRTGVPVLLNTSFNVKAEPIVCTIHDALRTFWSTGIEVLAAGNFIIRKYNQGVGNDKKTS